MRLFAMNCGKNLKKKLNDDYAMISLLVLGGCSRIELKHEQFDSVQKICYFPGSLLFKTQR